MILKLTPQLQTTLMQIAEVAKYIWEKGWAEANGGNLSINVTDQIGKFPNRLSSCCFTEDRRIPKQLAAHAFLITGSGLRKRDLISGRTGLEENAGIILINQEASGYYLIWGGKSQRGFKPTSELCSHLSQHLDLIQRGSDHRAMLHTHPIELIAISHARKFSDSSKKLTKILWSMLPEVRFFLPKGIGVVPYTLPGSQKLADLTINALRKYDVALWKKHGAVATGKDLMDAFDFIDIANKGATIFLRCLASGFDPEGLSDRELNELQKEFGL